MTKNSVTKRTTLVREMSAERDFTINEVTTIVNKTLEKLVAHAANDNSAAFVGFVTFKSTGHATRKGHNPQTGEAIIIPARSVP
ncbi:DNA-binding protein [Lactiplantibacillus pentosus]|jgi:DNA-binding protein HU-beta|uniref:DNA-binding protein HU n=1 Tax=Lactiplantibacillus pentosus TaxID=1589 RepID=A0AB37RMU1_LACPE|nr:DNA-binding protein [Lactiplantibacillus pentosus]RMW44146.1 DNA-binding protein [Lactiplantibacillus pentosus]RMW44755.1 DNA-binding protein [Lactiplantibacillus pentosus]RMW49089.1 DNA-binding protein [Lactiplantibacillus pentosus]RMW56387.1 DNA-binding protein [Lactiplantibacillus pentosus]